MRVIYLHDNEKMINREDISKIYFYYLIESDKLYSKLLKIRESYFLIPLNQLDTEIEGEDWELNFFKAVKNYQNTNITTHLYLLVIQTCDINSPPDATGKRYEDYVEVINPDEICNNILNILALLFENYFYQINNIPGYPMHTLMTKRNLIEHKIEEMIHNKEYDLEIETKVNDHVKIITDLRREQFQYLNKVLSLFNSASNIKNIDLSIAYSMLVSSIEISAEKYSDSKSKFEDFQTHIKIEEFVKGKLKNKLAEIEVSKILENVGDLIVKGAHLGIMAKFCDFFIKRFENSINDDLLLNIVKDIYGCRSKFLHVGVNFPNNNENSPGYYNIYNVRGNIRRSDDVIIIKELPSFSWMRKSTAHIIKKFITELYDLKDSETDKKKYSDFDRIETGILQATLGGSE